MSDSERPPSRFRIGGLGYISILIIFIAASAQVGIIAYRMLYNSKMKLRSVETATSTPATRTGTQFPTADTLDFGLKTIREELIDNDTPFANVPRYKEITSNLRLVDRRKSRSGPYTSPSGRHFSSIITLDMSAGTQAYLVNRYPGERITISPNKGSGTRYGLQWRVSHTWSTIYYGTAKGLKLAITKLGGTNAEQYIVYPEQYQITHKSYTGKNNSSPTIGVFYER